MYSSGLIGAGNIVSAGISTGIIIGAGLISTGISLVILVIIELLLFLIYFCYNFSTGAFSFVRIRLINLEHVLSYS